MAVEKSHEVLASFLPEHIVRRHQLESGAPRVPTFETHGATVMFSDVQGFTSLAERLARESPAGAERIHSVLNAFFGRLVEVIADHEGDVIDYAGDSALVMWTAPTHEELVRNTRIAVQCANRAHAMLRDFTLEQDLRIRIRVAIAAGRTYVATVGGVSGRWEYLVAGEPLVEMGAACLRAAPGDVILAPSAWTLVREHCTGEVIDAGYVRLARIDEEIPPRAPRAGPPSTASAHALRCYIPEPVLEHLDAGQSEWLAEFRQVTAMFAAVHGLDYRAEDVLTRLQTVVCMMQSAVERYGGAVISLMMDDKGTHLLAAWGLPRRAHEHDAEHALAAALSVQQQLREADLSGGIGITTGRLLCGPRGGHGHYRYAIAGDPVNVAARLMEAARDGILCDGETCQRARRQFLFEDMPPLSVRGKTEPVMAARPLLKHRIPEARPRFGFIGRDPEQRVLVQSLRALSAGQGGTVIIEGEAGVGKSRLVSELFPQIEKLGLRYLNSEAEDIEKHTPYYAWRAVVRKLLVQEAGTNPGPQFSYLDSQLEGDTWLSTWRPLLNDVLPLGIEENAITLQMSEEARAASARELMVHLLAGASHQRPSVVVIDDVHWMDSMSWALAASVSQHVMPLLLLLVTRTGYDLVPDTGKAVLESGNSKHIRLEALSRSGTAVLIRDRLGVDTISDEVVSLIFEKSGGLPLFSEELAYSLRDSGYLSLRDRDCTLSPGADGLTAVGLPDTIAEVITSRVDRLPASVQLTLKLASVVGRSLPVSLVADIHPLEHDHAALRAHFEMAVSHHLVHLDGDGPDQRCTFNHVTTQQVVYEQITFAQRYPLHEAVARWYEETYAEEMDTVYPLLAYHWTRARVPTRAFRYLHRAGAQAVERFANREAVRFLTDALNILVDHPASETASTQADCEWLLGHAQLGLGEITESQSHLVASVALLGWPVPRSAPGKVVGALALLGSQLVQTLLRLRTRSRRHADRNRLRAAAVGTLRLGQIAYFTSDTPMLLYTSQRCLSLAHAIGPSRELALVYGALVSTAGAVPLHGLARRYSRLGLEIASEIDEPFASAQVLSFLSIYDVGVGSWQQALEHAREARDLYGILGDRRRFEECLVIEAYVHYHTGRFAESYRCFEELAVAASARGDRQTRAWGILGKARIQIVQGRIDEAHATLREAAEFVSDRLSRIELQGLTAAAFRRSGDPQRAFESATRGLDLVVESRPSSFSTLPGTSEVAGTLLWLWESASNGQFDADPRDLERLSLRACRALSSFARIYPIGRPLASLRAGQASTILGRSWRAFRQIRKGLHAARAMGSPYEEALINMELARRTSGHASRASREAAGTILDRLEIEDAPR